MEKISKNGSETNSTIRINLDNLIPGKRFVGFICDKPNGKSKHQQALSDEFIDLLSEREE